MSPRLRLALVAGLAFVAFVVVATGHGRQLRLEREAHGFLQMDPEQGWPAPMHEIWQLDRARLKVGTAAAAVLSVAATLAMRGGLGRGLLAFVLWAPTVGFAVAAAFSQVRLRGQDAAAASAALPLVLAMLLLGMLCLAASVFWGLVHRQQNPQVPQKVR